MGTFNLLEAALLAFLLDVSVSGAIPSDVSQPVNGVKVIILTNPWRQVLQGVHQIGGPWERVRNIQNDKKSKGVNRSLP